MFAGRGRPEKDHGGVSPVFTGLFRHPERFMPQPPLAELVTYRTTR
jgi:hypothetical protein